MTLRVLQAVAGLIVLTALVAFTAGVVNAPERSRLPGEHANGAPGPLIQATEATPLSQEHIEGPRSEEHTSELQSLMSISYAVFCLKKKYNRNYQYKHIKPKE